MIESKLKVLVSSVRKLIRREGWKSIKGILEKTHTADIAQLLEALDDNEQLLVFKIDIPSTRRAEVLSYLKPDVQKHILENLEVADINQIVSNMATDDAADLLSDINEDLSKQILDSMNKEVKQEVQDLMSYAEDSAGGIMNAEFVSLNQDLKVADAIREIQEKDSENLVAFYIYLTDNDGRLVGVLSLKQLLLSKPQATLKDIMIRQFVSVTTETNQFVVADIVERYDFLSIPVLDFDSKLVGVITVDDVIDVIKEEAQEDLLAMGQVSSAGDLSFRGMARSRLPWLFFTFAGGIACCLLVEACIPSEEKNNYWTLTGFLPLLLTLTSTSGSQAATVAVDAILSGRISPKDTWEHWVQELKLALSFGLGFGILTYAFSILLMNKAGISSFIGTVLFFQILVAMTIGTVVPLTLRKLNLDPTVSTVTVFSAVSNVCAVAVLFGVAYRFFDFFGV